MKRISFFLALVLTVVAFGVIAHAQETIIRVEGDALFDANTIGFNLGNPGVNEQGKINVYIDLDNGPDAINGVQLGFKAYGTAVWSDQLPTAWELWPVDGTDPIGDGDLWSIADTARCYNCDGIAPDTFGLVGATISGGLPLNTLLVSGLYEFWFNQTGEGGANDGATFCLDSVAKFSETNLPFQWGTFAGPYPTTVVGARCWDVVFVPDLPPQVTNAPTVPIEELHCGVFEYDFDAVDPDGCSAEITWEMVSGPGSIDGDGVWSWDPGLGDVGVYVVEIRPLCPAANPGNAVSLDVTVTNQAPNFTLCPTAVFNASVGKEIEVQTEAEDGCNDAVTYSIVGGTYQGVANVDGTGLVTFTPDTDVPPGQTIVVEATDGTDASECTLEFNVSAGATYAVYIEKYESSTGVGAIQGQFHDVRVWVESAAELVGGFDFLFAYDASALTFMYATLDPALEACGWEYFTYRTGPFGNCNGACPTGMVAVTGILETNDGPNHPDCPPTFTSGVPNDLFTLTFLVSNDRNLECAYVPIRFFWMGCTDNTMSNQAGDVMFLAYRTFDYFGMETALYREIFHSDSDNSTNAFPSYLGPMDYCYEGNADPDKPQPDDDIDFFNGGIDIVCAGDIDDRGDINLNNVAYEIADAVIFTNYFIYGQSAFEILAADPFDPASVNLAIAAATAASDVNADGLALSVADLVYLIRVIVGDAAAIPKTNPVDLAYTVDNGVVKVDNQLGAMYLVLEGDANVSLLAPNVEMKQYYTGSETNVLVYSLEGEVLEGDVVNIGNARIEYFEAALFDGTPVRSLEIPSSFAVEQNYPNPFNPTTTIEFSLPASSDVSVKIYNVTGQLVEEMSGRYDAGVHQVVWDASTQASGVYFYRVVTDTSEKTMKMVLLK